MSDFGVIYFVDGLKNLYRKDVDLSLPIWNGLNSFQILHNRLSQLKTAGSVLLLPQPLGDVFVNFIAKTDTPQKFSKSLMGLTSSIGFLKTLPEMIAGMVKPLLTLLKRILTGKPLYWFL